MIIIRVSDYKHTLLPTCTHKSKQIMIEQTETKETNKQATRPNPNGPRNITKGNANKSAAAARTNIPLLNERKNDFATPCLFHYPSRHKQKCRKGILATPGLSRPLLSPQIGLLG